MQFTGVGTIQLVSNQNDVITYKANVPSNQFAVFSEIYYEAGWKAFVDGKETPIARVNYVLRGLPLSAGQHEIVFRFEPQGYFTGKSITTIAQIAMLILLVAGIFLEFRNRRSKPATA